MKFRTPLFSQIGEAKNLNLEEVSLASKDFDDKYPRIRPESFTANSLRGYLATYMSEDHSSLVAQLLLAIYQYSANQKLVGAALVDSLIDLAEDDAASSNVDNKNFREVITTLSTFSQNSQIALVVKASRLYYEINDAPDSIDMIVEVRPVFDKTASNQIGYIIRPTLHFESTKIFFYEKKEYSLTESQIVELKSQCERALIKISTIKSDLGKIADRGVVTFGATNE